MKKICKLLVSILLLVAFLPTFQGVSATDEEPDAELWNVLKPLSTTVTFLNTGAHPDDERSDFLAYLSRGLGVKTASLIANRGEGGQNEIGTELGNALGIIRSNEMIEAAKITGVKAYHLSDTTSDAIYDFGFSKSPGETLEKWGEDVTYERLIRFIRTYKPDIVMPSFRNVDSQHGHHRAITILSLQAFEDAADPAVFPEHFEEGLTPWQIKKVYLPAASDSVPEKTTSIEIGIYDPIYQMTYPQLGEESRYMHKSQGMGNDIPAEPRQVKIELVKATDSANNPDLFAGIPYNLADWAEVVPQEELKDQLVELQRNLDEIVELYPNREAILPKVQNALKDVERLVALVTKAELNEDIKVDLLHKLEIKAEQLKEASFVASSLEVKTTIDSYVLTSGEKSKVTMTITNNGEKDIHEVQASLVLPEGWKNSGTETISKLKSGGSETIVFDIQVPDEADYFDPYGEPTIQSKIAFKENGYTTESVQELEETVAVLPELSLTPTPQNVIVNTADIQDKIPVTVKVKNYFAGEKHATISLNLPEGWSSDPVETELTFSERFEEKEVTFNLTPPADIEAGDFEIEALAMADGKTFNTTVQEISYDHIKDSYYQYPSVIDGVAFELLKPDHLKIGYVESGFDKVADYLINAGFDVTKLTEEDLSSGDLSQYDTIVTGIRAYLSREDLAQNNHRLLEYVENGGHLVVQYHKPDDNWNIEETAPYPITIGSPSIRWRVTDENAAVTVTKPDHKLFNYPNQITENDWANWVQERGLYFPMQWDSNYETFLTMADPGEAPFESGILLAQYGQGTYLYTNLVFYRQMESQVPGAYRIFTNLISY
ncbi:NEW3 domain-containing protein [Bacillus litorisediminis]|uniref:NEW3 domain-containing protein n=1 Tax=Bacillus litorisediminis TaxID=2922713 RepID=UPI001FAFE8E3|nr:NEW3 domain-containing protein [Bacillus litorisediminis]